MSLNHYPEVKAITKEMFGSVSGSGGRAGGPATIDPALGGNAAAAVAVTAGGGGGGSGSGSGRPPALLEQLKRILRLAEVQREVEDEVGGICGGV